MQHPLIVRQEGRAVKRFHGKRRPAVGNSSGSADVGRVESSRPAKPSDASAATRFSSAVPLRFCRRLAGLVPRPALRLGLPVYLPGVTPCPAHVVGVTPLGPGRTIRPLLLT